MNIWNLVKSTGLNLAQVTVFNERSFDVANWLHGRGTINAPLLRRVTLIALCSVNWQYWGGDKL